MRDYVATSLELHLFFARIMKEHAFFMEIGFTKADVFCTEDARKFKEAFESLLLKVVESSEGIVDRDVLKSGEILTEYTFDSEKKTEELTGACINQKITKLENDLVQNCLKERRTVDQCTLNNVRDLNQWALELVSEFIDFKKWVLKQVLSCNMYTANYPLLLEHIIREAELYEQYIKDLESGCVKEQESIQKVELFWNQIMMEHALFIRGLLDPTENELIGTADDFASEYARLIMDARNMNQRTIDSVTNAIKEETVKYRDFKEAGTKGINECKIRSLIVPLLADHVLREANHYLRLLSHE
ncbi:DUF2935 domain-containing protein [Anaerosporobacter faecicola]|uniref:DUF2935 domain-containing protein n=1 Tax=Anaerosporobacter faecicola TaxID=2718714 RepID=UPI00143C7878|nr:DUF2935 domain-containing protein [Anaerosporobacter faecicola]